MFCLDCVVGKHCGTLCRKQVLRSRTSIYRKQIFTAAISNSAACVVVSVILNDPAGRLSLRAFLRAVKYRPFGTISNISANAVHCVPLWNVPALRAPYRYRTPSFQVLNTVGINAKPLVYAVAFR